MRIKNIIVSRWNIHQLLQEVSCLLNVRFAAPTALGYKFVSQVSQQGGLLEPIQVESPLGLMISPRFSWSHRLAFPKCSGRIKTYSTLATGNLFSASER